MGVWPLVGRDEELALFERLLLDDARGAVVVAPPGTGKTRLIREATRHAGEVAATELVVGTRSAQTLPLAAMAALLPEHTPSVSDAHDLFRLVRNTLAERAGGRPAVLTVDDAHLLDSVSAALVHHLAVAGDVRLLVAVRSGEPVEDAITALWRDGLAERVDLQPLGPDDVTALLRTVLGGEIEAASAWRLWSVAGGNPLYLHEVVNEAMHLDTLTDADGVWRWRGEVQVGARLRELVEHRLAVLDDDERSVVALLAVGETVAQELVESACAPRAVAALSLRGFVVSSGNGADAELRLDHPLFAEVVRSAIPVTERSSWCRFLAAAADPDTGDLGLLQRAVWQIDGGIATDPELLIRAAEHANSRFDGGLGERLAHAAMDAGGGWTAQLARAEACFQLGRFDEALDHVRHLEDTEISDELLARLAYVLAEAGYWGLGRVEETNEALRRIEARVDDVAPWQQIRALQYRDRARVR